MLHCRAWHWCSEAPRVVCDKSAPKSPIATAMKDSAIMLLPDTSAGTDCATGAFRNETLWQWAAVALSGECQQ